MEQTNETTETNETNETTETNETNETTETNEAPRKTVIRPNIANMVKTNGKLHKDDFVGNTLSGLSLDQVLEVVVKHGIDVHPYSHLNAGQQRMCLGNRLRKIVTKDETGETASAISELADGFRAENERAKAAKEAAKAEKAA